MSQTVQVTMVKGVSWGSLIVSNSTGYHGYGGQIDFWGQDRIHYRYGIVIISPCQHFSQANDVFKEPIVVYRHGNKGKIIDSYAGTDQGGGGGVVRTPPPPPPHTHPYLNHSFSFCDGRI